MKKIANWIAWNVEPETLLALAFALVFIIAIILNCLQAPVTAEWMND